MGRIVASFFISLDGVVESPDKWHFPYFNDEMGAGIGKAMETTTAFLMGRKLYNEWAAYWPGQGESAEPDPFGDFINNVPKYVVSNSIEQASWHNTTVVSGDVAARLAQIKERSEGDIGMCGSATVVRWLLAHGLLDELNLMVHPIVVGHGQRLFEDGATHPLELVRHDVFKTGVLHLSYVPAEEK